MEKAILVSIIIPVYNVEQYLRECVDSVLNQSYPNLEIILVDDGSKDSSSSICDEYAQNDNRIIAIHKQNGGLSSARNVGIKNAQGKYLVFIDSDDWISKTMVKDMVEAAEETDSHLITSPITTEVEKISSSVKEMQYRITQKELLKSFFSEGFIPTSASGKMYMRTLWENVEFPEGKIFEDYATIYKIVLKSNNIYVLPNYYYYYRPNPNSITGAKFTKSKLQYFEITKDITQDLHKRNINEFDRDIDNRTVRYAISFFKDISRSHYNDRSTIDYLTIVVRKGMGRYLWSKYPLKSKMYGLLISAFPFIALKVFNK